MVEIKLSGRGLIIASIQDAEDTGDCIEFGMILDEVRVLANDEDITAQKGKYVNKKTWIKDMYLLNDENPHYFRVMERSFNLEARYEIDVDDFDPKKLQLIKSDYELEFLPYGIVLDTIIYDGEMYDPADDDEFYMNFDYPFTDFHIEEVDKMPYVD